MALTYLPLVFLFTHRLFERRDLLSLGLLAASVGTLMLANHVQIAYYVFMVIGLYIAYSLIVDIRTHTRDVLSATGMFVAALAIGSRSPLTTTSRPMNMPVLHPGRRHGRCGRRPRV